MPCSSLRTCPALVISSERVTAWCCVNRTEWLQSFQGGEPGHQHFRIYFDEYGCYDIMASSFEVRA